MRRAVSGVRRAWRLAAAGVVCLAMSVAGSAAAADQQAPIAPAERLLFMSAHLAGVAAQTELDYVVNYSGPPEKLTDTVRVLVLSPDNTKGDARISDHTGPVEVPGGLPCNPVILYFLEHDIAEMEQLTGGQRRYFQKRVRLALAAAPPITPVTGEAAGKRVKAQKIVIQPYLDDPNAARFAQYTDKRYTFIMADDVPGQVVMIRTEVPGPNNDFAHPLQTETLNFQGALKNLAPSKPDLSTPVKPGNAPRASR
jgi:hypothetical protein